MVRVAQLIVFIPRKIRAVSAPVRTPSPGRQDLVRSSPETSPRRAGAVACAPILAAGSWGRGRPEAGSRQRACAAGSLGGRGSRTLRSQPGAFLPSRAWSVTCTSLPRPLSFCALPCFPEPFSLFPARSAPLVRFG